MCWVIVKITNLYLLLFFVLTRKRFVDFILNNYPTQFTSFFFFIEVTKKFFFNKKTRCFFHIKQLPNTICFFFFYRGHKNFFFNKKTLCCFHIKQLPNTIYFLFFFSSRNDLLFPHQTYANKLNQCCFSSIFKTCKLSARLFSVFVETMSNMTF